MNEIHKPAPTDESEENPQDRFLKHLAENEGKPINPAIAEAARNELKQGERTGFAVYGEEAARKAVVKGFPEGKLFETKIPEAELPEAIQKLSEAREAFIACLTGEPSGFFSKPRETTIAQLKENVAKLPSHAKEALEVVEKYMDLDPNTILFDLPDAIRDSLSHLDAVQTHRVNRSL